MRAMRYDHSALNGIDVAGSARIFVEALDFSVTEELVDEASGTRLGIFLSCSNKAHDIAFLAGPEDANIHHTTLRLESWNDVGTSSDCISTYDITIEIGPTGPGITRGQTHYLFHPSWTRKATIIVG